MKIAIDRVSTATATVDLLSTASAPLAGVVPTAIAGVHATATHANATKLATQLIGMAQAQATSAAIVAHVDFVHHHNLKTRVVTADATQMVGATAPLAGVAPAVITRVHATATHAHPTKLVTERIGRILGDPTQASSAAIVVTGHTGLRH